MANGMEVDRHLYDVLLVDDNPADREGIRDLIDWESIGQRIAGLAANGREGLELVRRLKPDILLTDVSMPIMNGLELSAQVNRELPETRILFMSCFDEFEYVREAMRNKAHAYILKPIRVEELTEELDKIRRVMDEEQRRAASVRALREQAAIAMPSMPQLRARLDHLVDHGAPGDIEAFVEAWYGPETEQPGPHEKTLSFAIVNGLQVLLLERGRTLHDVFGDDAALFAKLNRYETILDIRRWVFNLIDGVRLDLHPEEGSRNRRIVEDIRAFIEANHARIDSVEEVARHLYMSAGHANVLFKQQTGTSIFDELTRVRMEKAKAMLADPYVKVYEVAERVGYRSKSHFTAVFRDFTGMTPKQYADRRKG